MLSWIQLAKLVDYWSRKTLDHPMATYESHLAVAIRPLSYIDAFHTAMI
jgi:hypothetical protein